MKQAGGSCYLRGVCLKFGSLSEISAAGGLWDAVFGHLRVVLELHLFFPKEAR